MLLLVNIARMSPRGYIATWKPDPEKVTGADMAPTKPLYEHFDLARAARYHSNDMYTNKCFTHESCDGTSFETRVRSFYEDSRWIAENIAGGYRTPEAVIKGWIESHGHRMNIMRSSMYVMGNGQVGTLWTQNFGGGANKVVEGDRSNPIAAGSHLLVSPSRSEPNKLVFYANYLHEPTLGSAPEKASVFVNGTTELPMTLEDLFSYQDNSSTRQGTFSAEMGAMPDDPCMQYYFEFVTSGGTISARYPEDGYLFIGESCEPDDPYEPPSNSTTSSASTGPLLHSLLLVPLVTAMLYL